MLHIEAEGPKIGTELERQLEINYRELREAEQDFDAAMCVDAMENDFPEDWPLVLANLRRALRPGGHLYLTVELLDEQELERVFAEATASGLPVVRGEHTSPGGGYHSYPPLDQVAAWVRDAGLESLDSGIGDDYYHLLASGR